MTAMLGAAERLKILATSRYRLQLPGETVFTLHGLSLPEHGAEDAAQYAAVELFRQSARRALPEFALTPGNLPGVVQIGRLVQGMPLAILLAAAWVPVLSTAEIAGEIQQGLDILEASGSALPERQRSVRAVFDQAWSKMSAGAQGDDRGGGVCGRTDHVGLLRRGRPADRHGRGAGAAACGAIMLLDHVFDVI